MVNTLLAIKKGMTSGYDARGRRVGATQLQMNQNYITQVKSKETKDGYQAVQLGILNKKSVKKPQQGHFKKAGVPENLRFLKEVKAQTIDDLQAGGQLLMTQVFAIGDAVKVTGKSKGKGFQGGVRRHGFHGGPKTHGQSDRHRAPGSIGAGTTPGRVYKGKRMAGHMGSTNVSYTGLEVIGMDQSKNLLIVKGGIPGPIGGLVTVQKVGQIKGYTPPPEEKPEEESEQATVDSEQPKTEETSDQPESTETKEETENAS